MGETGANYLGDRAVKHKTNLYFSDKLELSLIDIIKLLAGRTLKGRGLEVSVWQPNKIIQLKSERNVV